MAEAGARAALIERFLAARGWAGGRRTPLAGDASFRRYQRLRRRSEEHTSELQSL